MPTYESLEVAYRDQISAGAKASADSLNKLADAQDRVAASTDTQDQVVRRSTPSATQLVNRYDSATKSALKLAAANTALATGTETITQGVAKGTIAQVAGQGAIEGLTAKVVAASGAAQGHSMATAGMTRELVVLGHEVMTGNYSRLAGSTVVLTERMGNLGGIISGVAKLFTTFGGLATLAGVAAVGAVVAIGVESLIAASKLATLQDELSATRDNAKGWAAEVMGAAKIVSSSTSAAAADVQKSAQVIASNPMFTGTKQQLADLTTTAYGLSQVLGITMPDAAKKLSEGLSDPAKIATQLATSIDPLRTIDSVTLGLIVHMQAVGDKIGAAALLNEKFAESARAAADNASPLGKAWRDLVNALSGSGSGGDGKSVDSLVGMIGTAFKDAAIATLEAIAKMITGIKDFRNAIDAAVKAQVPADIGGKTINGRFVPDSDVPFAAETQQPVAVNGVSGARGMMQILPSTAALTPQYDPNTLQGNIELGVIDFQRKLSAIGASPTGVGVSQADLNTAIMHYGENTPQYLASVQGQNISRLDPAIADSISRIATDRGAADQRLITALQQIALQENQGQMAPLPGQGRGGVYNQPSPLFGPESPTATQTALDNIIAGRNATADANAIAGVAASNSILKQQKDILGLEQALKELQEAKEKVEKQDTISPADQDLIKGYNTSIAQTKVNLLDVIDPTRQATQATKDQATVDAVVGEADAKLLAIRLQIDRQRANNPQAPESEAAAAAQIAAALDLQAAGYTKLAGQATTTIKNQNDLADAWKIGADAAQDVQSNTDAYTTAIKLFSTSSPDFQKHLADIKTLQDGVRDSTLRVKAAQEGANLDHQIEMVKAETDTLGQNADERARYLAHLQAEYDLRIKFPGDAMKPMRDALLAETDTLVANKQALANQQAVLSELSNSFTQAFDTISAAMVNSFLSGGAAAVNWSNVMKSVVQQVIAEFLKLAILNPLLNSLFGDNKVTLGGVGGLLGLGGGAAEAGGGSSGGGGGLLSVLGLGNSVAGQGGFGLGDVFGGVKSFLGTQVFPGQIQPGIAGAVGDLTPGVSIGGLLGGAGLGFGAGSLAGSFIQSSLGKTGPAPQFGSGIGAAGGALLGSLIGSPILGGLLGGVLGGGVGGLIGPKPPSPFSSTYVGVGSSGQLNLGGSVSQATSTDADRAAAQAAVAAVNAVLTSGNLKITEIVGVGGGHLSNQPGDLAALQIGTNSPNGPVDPSKFSSLNAAFSNFRFSSSDPHTQAFLSAQGAGGGGFPDLATLQTTIGIVQKFVAQVGGTEFASKIDSTLASVGKLAGTDLSNALDPIAAFVTTTVPALLAVGKNSGSLGQAIAGLNAQFAPAIAQAHALGYKEQELTATRDKAIADVQAQERKAAADQAAGALANYATVHASISGEPVAILQAQIAAFDLQAQQQREALATQYKGILGDAYTFSFEFVTNSSALEKSLGEQRLAIQKQFNDQIIAASQAANRADQSVAARQFNAQATLGTLAPISSSLYSFDISAQAQREDLAKSLTTAFGAAFAATKSFADQMIQLETTLGLERLVIQKQYNDQITAAAQAAAAAAAAALAAAAANVVAFNRTTQTLYARQIQANITLGATDPAYGALAIFDQQAQQQRDDLAKSLTTTFGAAFAASTEFAYQMAFLEKTLGLERLVVQKQSNDALLQAQQAADAKKLADQQTAANRVSGDITNLQQYANSLQSGSNSPLSPQAQYSLAGQQFNAVSGAAAAGNITSIEQLSQYSDQFLNASRAVNGSGAGYAADFQRVLAALSSVVSKPASVLTNAAFTQATQDQTTTLANQLNQINVTLGQIKVQLTQTATKPARAA